MSGQEQLLDAAFRIFEIEYPYTWRQERSYEDRRFLVPGSKWAAPTGEIELQDVRFNSRTFSPTGVDVVKFLLLAEDVEITVIRGSKDLYDDAFTREFILPPIENFLLHDHQLCLDAIAARRKAVA